MFSCRLLKFYEILHKFIPGTSIAGFIYTLEEISAFNGRVCLLAHLAFSKADVVIIIYLQQYILYVAREERYICNM